MKRGNLKRLSVVSAIILMASLSGPITIPAIEAERLRMPTNEYAKEIS
jgi:hypothetical protein